MRDYKIAFTGRTLHAIGIFYPITATVQADSDAAAIAALYERFDSVHDAHEVLPDGTRRKLDR